MSYVSKFVKQLALKLFVTVFDFCKLNGLPTLGLKMVLSLFVIKIFCLVVLLTNSHFIMSLVCIKFLFLV